MDDKLREFAKWHGIDTRDAGNLLLAATDNNEFTHLDASRLEEMGIKPGDSIEEVTSAIRNGISGLEDEKSRLESAGKKKEAGRVMLDIGLINQVLQLLE